LVSNHLLNNLNLNQSNWLRTLIVHSSSFWNRIEKGDRKLGYRIKKEEEEKYAESIFICKNRKLNEKLNKELGTATLSLFEKTIIVILIPFNHFPTVKGLLIGL
jgi:hypothetical protein